MRACTTCRSNRGNSLLVAMGLLTVLSLGMMSSLSMVSGEAEVQGNARRWKEAFFAAEAGMAEARELIRIRNADQPTYTGLMQTGVGLDAVSSSNAGDDGIVPTGQTWFDVFPLVGGSHWIMYTLSQGTGPNSAIDPTVTTTDQEMMAWNPGQKMETFADQRGVRYRVFMKDDDDDANYTSDANKRVWLIAVGEVTSLDANGNVRVLARAVTRSLITNDNTNPSTPGYSAQKGQGSEKSFSLSEQAAPDLTQSTTL